MRLDGCGQNPLQTIFTDPFAKVDQVVNRLQQSIWHYSPAILQNLAYRGRTLLILQGGRIANEYIRRGRNCIVKKPVVRDRGILEISRSIENIYDRSKVPV